MDFRRPLLSAALVAALLPGCTMMGGTSSGDMDRPARPTMDLMAVRPMMAPPAWAPTIDPQMLAVVEQLMAFGNVPLPQTTAFQARNQKSATGAVRALLMKNGMPPTPPMAAIAHRIIPVGPAEGLMVRTYTPMGAAPSGRARPLIVYYHGGGWVIADLDTYEPSAMALAAQTGAVVMSVAYRQAPEHPFPAAHDDALAAYRWATQNAAMLGADAARIALVGESAGGNLAVATALSARAAGLPMPVAIVSVYPIADGDTQSPSYDQYANAVPLNRPAMEWFFQNYLGAGMAGASDPRIALVRADVAGMPPTTVINAEIDPLRSEGEDLARRMEAAGVDVEQQTFAGVTHEFFGMAAVLEQAVEAQALAALRLRAAFGM